MRVDLRKSVFILPNLFTLSSIFCGFYAILIAAGTATNDHFYRAALLIVFAMFFDTIDGRVARLTKTQSAFGVQIDSLADVVSFGIAPAVLVYRWSLDQLGVAGLIVSFAFAAAGAIRLARFNVLTMGEKGAPKKPSKFIVGLPIPGAAGILVSLVAANHAVGGALPGSPAVIVAVVLSLSFFMVSTIRFRSFKDIRLSWRSVTLIGSAIGSSIFVALRFHISVALVWLLAAYIALGLIEMVIELSRRTLRRTPPAAPQTDENEGRST